MECWRDDKKKSQHLIAVEGPCTEVVVNLFQSYQNQNYKQYDNVKKLVRRAAVLPLIPIQQVTRTFGSLLLKKMMILAQKWPDLPTMLLRLG